jgi:muconolactone delta-isomerase
MLYMFQGRLEKPAEMSNAEFYGLWEKESEAAVALAESGLIKWVYKIAGRPEIVWLVDATDHDDMDRFLEKLPIFSLGFAHLVRDLKVTPLREYAGWYTDLKRLAHSQ